MTLHAVLITSGEMRRCLEDGGYFHTCKPDPCESNRARGKQIWRMSKSNWEPAVAAALTEGRLLRITNIVEIEWKSEIIILSRRHAKQQAGEVHRGTALAG